MPGDKTTVIRPSAILHEAAARAVLHELEQRDVSQGGLWNASAGLWQRYDVPWDGEGSGPGRSKVLGTIAAAYGTPTKYDITIFRVTVTDHGQARGWSVERITDDALQYADLTLASCPRADLVAAPEPDPFHR